MDSANKLGITTYIRHTEVAKTYTNKLKIAMENIRINTRNKDQENSRLDIKEKILKVAKETCGAMNIN